MPANDPQKGETWERRGALWRIHFRDSDGMFHLRNTTTWTLRMLYGAEIVAGYEFVSGADDE